MPDSITPRFTHVDVRVASDRAIYDRAVALVSRGAVRQFKATPTGYLAFVDGSRHPYRVSLSARRIDEGYCECHMGQNGEFCKHLLALALTALDSAGVREEDARPVSEEEAKKQISEGVKHFKAYAGPSRTWFVYQRTLDKGAYLVTEALPLIEPTKASVNYLWNLVMRLSNKLAMSGIDDSDGTVGGCVSAIVGRLVEIAHAEPALREYIATTCTDDTGFGFEDDLHVALQQAVSK